jgi:peptide/nickel transport system substrate-binding protein/nickel transport system substrate-binding protein
MNSIAKIQMTNDEEKVKDIFTFLLNYDNDNVINVPIYYVKDMILFNSNKIEDYTITSTPLIFEIDNVKPVE